MAAAGSGAADSPAWEDSPPGWRPDDGDAGVVRTLEPGRGQVGELGRGTPEPECAGVGRTLGGAGVVVEVGRSAQPGERGRLA